MSNCPECGKGICADCRVGLANTIHDLEAELARVNANREILTEANNQWYEKNAALEAELQRYKDALFKLRSYNADIAAGRINYRPLDHIQVIDEALRGRE